MTITAVEQKIRSHPLFAMQIPVQMQLGLPRLYEERGTLILHYTLHREQYRDGVVLFYPPAYTLKLAHPFNRIVLFEELRPDAEQVLGVAAEEILASKAQMEALYAAADDLVTLWQIGEDSGQSLRNYRARFADLVNRLGLQELYGG